MTDSIRATGSCLCGEVKLEADAVLPHVGACHCSMCRKWTGGPMLVVDCQAAPKFSGEQHVSVYSSSDWAERGFCAKCGTHLFYRLKQSGQYVVPVGLLNLSETLTFDQQIFIEEKPEYYSFANETKNMTGAEVFAMYSGN